MTPKLYKAAEVCEIAQLQPFVLRSWEKEFPGIGVQKSSDSPRLYRQSDVDQLLRIKQLVFGDGLTLSGARRKIEE
jgi:DNA-binding transcriptional MerR regulator